MKNKASLIVGGLIALFLIVYMVTFQVQFNEAVVLTTFEKAGEGDVYEGAAGNAGLKFKLPWPIQDVRRYDTRLRILDDMPEQQQTQDSYTVIVNSFLTWRIKEPLKYHQALGFKAEAEKRLLAILRDAKSVIGEYRFDELTNVDAQKLKLAEVEAKIKTRVQSKADEQGFGIDISVCGIKLLILPEDVTKKIQDRMKQTETTKAEQAKSEGEATKKNIVEKAKSDADKIMAFANRRAAKIQNEAFVRVGKLYESFQKDPDFEIFRLRIEALKAIKNNSTIIIDKDHDPLHVLNDKELLNAKPAGEAAETK